MYNMIYLPTSIKKVLRQQFKNAQNVKNVQSA